MVEPGSTTTPFGNRNCVLSPFAGAYQFSCLRAPPGGVHWRLKWVWKDPEAASVRISTSVTMKFIPSGTVQEVARSRLPLVETSAQVGDPETAEQASSTFCAADLSTSAVGTGWPEVLATTTSV